MSRKVKLEDVTGEQLTTRQRDKILKRMGKTGPAKAGNEAAFVDEFSGNAAIGVISAALSSAFILVVGLVVTAVSVDKVFVLIPGLLLAGLAYFMYKKSRIAAILSFGTWLLVIGFSAWNSITNSGPVLWIGIIDVALLAGLWKGVEGISGYHQHQKEQLQKDPIIG